MSVTLESPKSYSSEAIRFLNSKFNDKTLYNLRNPGIAYLYKNIVERNGEPTIYASSKDSWRDIFKAVSDHIEKNGDRSLIVVSGPASDIWFPTIKLEDEYGCAYVSAPPLSVSSENASQGQIELQMKGDLGVLKYMGYPGLPEFLEERKSKALQNPRSIIIGIEKVEIKKIYSSNNESGQSVYPVICEFMEAYRPSSLLYCCKGLDTEYVKNEYRNYLEEEQEIIYTYSERGLARDRMIEKAADLNIPVSFSDFGRIGKKRDLQMDTSKKEDFRLTGD